MGKNPPLISVDGPSSPGVPPNVPLPLFNDEVPADQHCAPLAAATTNGAPPIPQAEHPGPQKAVSTTYETVAPIQPDPSSRSQAQVNPEQQKLYQASLRSQNDHHRHNQALWFRTKRILHHGRAVRIVLQPERGACSLPIVALVNALSLRGDIDIPLADDPARHPMPRTSASFLIEALGGLAMERFDRGPGSPATRDPVLVEETIEAIEKLASPFRINYGFSSPTDYEYVAETKVFKAFGVRLVHGWVADPSADGRMAHLLHKYKHDELLHVLSHVDAEAGRKRRESPTAEYELPYKAKQPPTTDGAAFDRETGALVRGYGKQAEEWLDHTARRLSLSGILALQRDIEVGDLAVFSRQDHFSVLTKSSNGVLLQLVTDESLVVSHCVWQTVEDVDDTNTRFVPEYPVPMGQRPTTTTRIVETIFISDPALAVGPPPPHSSRQAQAAGHPVTGNYATAPPPPQYGYEHHKKDRCDVM